VHAVVFVEMALTSSGCVHGIRTLVVLSLIALFFEPSSLRSDRFNLGPKWGTFVNEPGGRLFGEAIRKPGERRQWFDWEYTIYPTIALSVLLVVVGFNSRPPTSSKVRDLSFYLSRCLWLSLAGRVVTAEDNSCMCRFS
jgi:hypothetical protein